MGKEFKQTFIDGVDNDTANSRVNQTSAVFIKNMTANLNANPNSDSLAGSNLGVYTPLERNEALNVTLPGGTNYCVGFYSSDQTNEGYAFIYNSNGTQIIYRIDSNGGIVTVFSGNLPLLLDPQYFIAEGKCTLVIKSHVDPVTNQETFFKFLIFTNDRIQQYFISVDDSISTNSYTTAHFAGAGTLYDANTLIHLGVPTPNDAIQVVKVAPVSGDEKKQNLLIRQSWEFRRKNYDVFGRPSIHGMYSTPYIVLIGGGGCLTTSNNLSRCVDLIFDAGNPLVDRIDIEFRKSIGAVDGEPIMSGWYKCETIYRWDNTAGAEWYNRPVNPAITYNATTNKITYRFCGDKNCALVDQEEAALVEPGIPRLSKSLALVNKEIALANNTRGFQPVDPAQIAKVTYDFVTPTPSVTCDPPPMRDIVVYAEIINPHRTMLIIIRQMPYSGGVVGFGVADDSSNNPSQYDQVFPGKTNNEGFPAYLVGMNGGAYAVTTEQVDFDPSVQVAGVENDTHLGTASFTSHNYVLQKVKMRVPAGKYLLRFGSHKARITDPDFQKTSTTVLGLSSISNITNWYNYYGNLAKEIEIDCTGGDVILNQPGDPIFVIMDMSYAGAGSTPNSSPARAIDGYLVEDMVGGVNTPIEMNPVMFQSSSAAGGGVLASYGSFFTDHNGYFFAGGKGHYMNLQINMDDCTVNNLFYAQSLGAKGIKHGDGSGTSTFGQVQGNWRNKVSLYTGSSSYPDSGRRHIKGKIGLCSDGTIGVPGIPVVLTKCGFGVSDGGGNYSMVAHGRYNYVNFYTGKTPFSFPPGASAIADYSTSPNNRDLLIYSQKGGCAFTACGSCNYYVADVTIAYIGCGSSRLTTVTLLQVNVPGVNIYGIRSGGKYPMAFWLEDNIGRRTYAQVLQGDAQFVIAPNLNDPGYQMFALGSIRFTIAAGTNFGSEFVLMHIGVAPDVMKRDFISWPTDWVQFVDNTGADNSSNPSQIRIYYNSLREYNKQHNFSTNLDWQIIANNDNGIPVKGDVVEFIMNGDGSWFPSVIAAQVTYSNDGAFFTIDYTNDLANLTNGALYRIVRQKNCVGNYIYYEQCLSIKLVAGVPQTLSGTVPYFDSYILSRQIPVPILAGQSGPIAPGGTPSGPLQYTSTNNVTTIANYADKNAQYNNVINMSVTDALTSYPFFFESPSPSDLWGSHVCSRGRPNVVNPDECQQRIHTETSLSGVLSERGVLNFLGWFVEAKSQVFDINTWGGISAILVDVSTMLVICERDHFTVNFGSSSIRTDANGNVISQNQYGIFGAPERRTGVAYGLNLKDINTLRRFAGKVIWLDRNYGLVLNNFSSSAIFKGNDAYIRNKISQVNLLNQNIITNGLTYFAGGIDPETSEYYFSSFNIPAAGSPSYFNALPNVDLSVNETTIYSIENGKYKGMVAFTPENYGMMLGYEIQKNFITFKNGVPYIHHQGVNGGFPFNNFYGVQAKKMVAVLVNPSPETVKRYLAVAVMCKEHKFVADTITTQSDQLSNIPSALWTKVENFFTSCYYCDINTQFDPSRDPIVLANPFYEGDVLFGLWLRQLFVSEDVDDSKYCELNAIVTTYIDSQKSPN